MLEKTLMLHKRILNRYWKARKHGYPYHGRSGLSHGNTCDVLFVHWRKLYMDTQTQVAIGNSTATTISGTAGSTQLQPVTERGEAVTSVLNSNAI